ncbi:MAG TPA: glutathione S-transferase family protein [Caulobacteraceae bacterium]|jgi:glutathione S-transferase|nr:glutathione S-transferase family protein [Caulobacteraceae bacterium]
MELVIGDKNFSSWSLRPWLVLKRAGATFGETLVRLRQPGTAAEVARHSPSGKVPLLRDGEVMVWDSLAICEYLAERFPAAGLWPADVQARALGRSAVAEMHSGFASLRGELPMDLALHRVAEISEATQTDIRRIVQLWASLCERFGKDGPWLLGPWSIADAFYTPVATRFRSYGVRLSDYGDLGAGGAYCEMLLEQPDYLEWEAAAKAEAAAA